MAQLIFGTSFSVTRVAVCSGNHDLNAESPGGERIADWFDDLQTFQIATDGMAIWFGDVMVSVFPWWDGPEAKARIAEQLARDAQESPAFWAWVYHAPPAQSPTSWAGSRFFGDPELSEWIETYQPDLVLSGHVHQAPFVTDGAWADKTGKTWVFNMGQQPGEIPSHIIFDTSHGKALWYSIAGSEELDLNAADAAPQPLTAAPDWITA